MPTFTTIFRMIVMVVAAVIAVKDGSATARRRSK